MTQQFHLGCVSEGTETRVPKRHLNPMFTTALFPKAEVQKNLPKVLQRTNG